MVTINKKPDALSFSGNLKEFVLTSINLVRFKLKQGTTLLLDQSYEPGENNLITIDVSSVVENCLTFHLREGELHYEQSDIAADFTADIDGTEHPFRVLRGGIRNLADTPANWLTQHFLTWQPIQKKVTYYSPEWLTYYAVSNCSIVLKAYFDDKSTQELTLLNCLAGHAYTVNTQYAVIAGLLGNKLPMYYDVYAATGSTRLSEIQRYLADSPRSADEEWISWENSIGGYDTARVYGTTTLNAEHTHNIAQLGDTAEEYDIETERKYVKNTGHLSDYERRWFLDFFPSKAKYIYSGNALRKIVVVEDSVSYKSNELPSSYTFTYKFAHLKPYLNLQRNPNELPAGITIPVPSLPDFTLPPRLAEYPRIPLAEGVLLPVHDPQADRLGATTFGAILAAILAAVEDAAIGNANYEILKTWIRENFLSKINKDEARDVITFLQGLVAQGTSRFTHAQMGRLNVDDIAEFGDNVPGYTGGYINREGEAELKSLILRTFLAVPEIRFNRTTVFKGRNWITPGGGCVLEEVSGLANGTYFCKPKLEEGEPLSFANDDILEAFWHDKNVQTGAIKGFQQMHFRVASADYDERTFILVPRNDVSIARPFMNLAQYGNFTNPERQTSILLDSTYGNNCILFLEGVNSWDITPSMEKSWLGKRKGRTVAGINMDNYSGKLQDMVFSGKLFQVDDVTGDDIRVPLDKGAWQENTRYAYYDRVSYAGSLWLCVAEAGTTNAPSSNEPDWLLQVSEGKPGEGFTPQGLWDKYTTYKKGDVVSYNGNSFVYTSPTPAAGITPIKNPGGYIKSGGRQVISGGKRVFTGNPHHPWSLLSEAGRDGINGADGVDGKDGTSIIWKGEFPSHPANPQNGWAYKSTTDKKSYVYQAGAWYQMTVDGIDGNNGKDGLSIIWKGNLKDAPANPEKNWVYKDTDNGIVYIYTGTAWAMMVVDGSDGTDGAPGSDGNSVYITYNDSPSQPATPTGNGTTNGWHTAPTPTAIWISQKIAPNADAGTWGTPIKIKGEVGMTPRGDWNMTTNYIVGDMVKFAKCTWIAKVANVGIPPVALLKTGGKFVKSGGKYITRGSYKLYSNNTTWTLFTEPQELPAIEHEYTAYHTSPTKPAKPIYTGNSQGWICNGTVPVGARWKSTKKATTPAGGTWSDVVIYAPVDGAPGTDATAYWLTSSVTSIVFNTLGTPTPGAFLVNCKKQTGDRSVEACTDLYLAARKSANGTDYTSHVAPVKAASINVSVLTGIKSYTIRAYKTQTDAQAWNANFINELGVSVVSDGQRGATGAMPRNCGQWLAAETYIWSEGYRDIVFYAFSGVNYQFQVKTYGASLKNVPPTSANGDANWEVANKFKFVATDTLLADGANIAGFMYKNNKMQSQHLINQVAAILLDGINGSGHFGGGNFRFHQNGDIDITGTLRTSLNGNRIVISPEGEGSSIKLINKNGATLLNIFFDKEDGYENYYPNINLAYGPDELKINRNGIRIFNSSYFTELKAGRINIYETLSGGRKLIAHLP